MTVTNPYYEFDPPFVPGTVVRSDAVNTQYQAIQNAFDLLPDDPDAVTTDTAVFAPESGSGNNYVVTMPNTRTSNQDGDGIRFYATHTNTAGTTLNVDSIGAVTLVNWDGTALTGGEIVSSRLYEIRYDAVGVRFVLAATTDAALQVTFAEEWATNPEDDPVSVAAGGDDVTTFSALHYAAKSAAGVNRVLTDIVTATPPTTELVTGVFDIFDADVTDELATLGFNGSPTLRIRNKMHGAGIALEAESSAGVNRSLFGADPDGFASIYSAGILRLRVTTGAIAVFSDGSTDTEDRLVDFNHADGTLRARIGHDNSDVLQIRSLIHGAVVTISGEDTGGTNRNILTGDPDNDTSLYHAGIKRLTAASGGGVSIFSDGDTDTEIRTIHLRQQSGLLRSTIGFGSNDLLLIQNHIHGGSVQITAEDTGTVERNLFLGDPDGGASVFYTGIEKFRTHANGILILADIVTATPPTTEAVTGRYDIYDADGSDLLSQIGFGGSNSLGIRNHMHGGSVFLSGQDIAGSTKTIFAGDPDGAADNYYAGLIKLQTATTGITVRGLLSGGVGGVQDTRINFAQAEGTQRGQIGFLNSADFTVQALNNSGHLILQARDAGSVSRTILSGDPDAITFVRGDTVLQLQLGASGALAFQATTGGSSEMYNNNIKRVQTGGSGIFSLRSDTDTDTENRTLYLAHQDGTVRALIGHESTDVLAIRNQIHGGNVIITAEDAVGTERTILVGNPDAGTTLRADTDIELQVAAGSTALFGAAGGATTIYYNNATAARTITAATGGLEANNTLTGAGFERVLTESDFGVFKIKLADESKPSDITLADDDTLAGWSLEADTRYIIEGYIPYTQNVGNIQFVWQISQTEQSGATSYQASDQGSTGAEHTTQTFTDGLFFTTITDTDEAGIIVRGTLHTHLTLASVLDWQWAQGTSDANPTIVRDGAWMRITKVG